MSTIRKPNIVFVLADDLGYGDVSCLNPEGKIPTPNIDSIAKQGMKFTNMHASSSVCSPSRYSVLTGRYCWRKMSHGIVDVYGDAIIPPERMTVANLLKEQGYDTACFGKWHLGMGWKKTGRLDEINGNLPEIDFTYPVTAGPTTNGFDYYFGVDVPNWPPYCFVENKNTVGIPSGKSPFGISNEEISIQGPCVEGWHLENILFEITNRACSYIKEKAKSDKPFFIYYPLTSPHTPLAVNNPWRGASGLNTYADFVVETDAMVGKLLDTLDETGTAENTLFIFTSDNGCAHYIGADYLESKGHFPSYIYRGYKADAWDGGHRIPFVAKWPGIVRRSGIYANPASLVDFFATVAEITGTHLPDNAAEDSISFLSVLKGRAQSSPRDVIISHSLRGKFSICKNNWKLILCSGSGGFDMSGGYDDIPLDTSVAAENQLFPKPKYQLYDLEKDPSEQNNLYSQNPEIVSELTAILGDVISQGRSTPGKPQKNEIECIEYTHR